MAGKYYFLIAAFLLARCAQVGTITGGPRDEAAPRPIVQEIQPPLATTNYTGNTFVIPFDEYFQLNNPSKTIRMVPPHTTIEAEMKKKTLYLSWSDTLEANTTYAIYLNGTVKDLNEGNDTTLQLVFSTGPVIDSINYSVAVIDAFSGDPLSDITVALFDPTTNKLKSFTKSQDGVATLNYLSAGAYRLLAFEDENLDLEIDSEERVGFPEGGEISVDSSFFDSIPIRTYAPLPKQRYKVKSFVSPGSFLLEGASSFDFFGLESVAINGQEADFYRNKSNDAYFVIGPDTLGTAPVEITLTHNTDSTLFSDTLTYRFRKNEREKRIQLHPIHPTSLAPDQVLTYEMYGSISAWEDSLIEIMHVEDSTFVSNYAVTKNAHQLMLTLDSSISGDLSVRFKPGAVVTPFGTSVLFTETVQKNTEEDFGILKVSLSGYTEPILLEVIKSKKVIESLPIIDSSQPLTLDFLEPGVYTFRVIRDRNNNQLWDRGALETLTQPEQVDTYSKPIKVRANWEVEVTLNAAENE